MGLYYNTGGQDCLPVPYHIVPNSSLEFGGNLLALLGKAPVFNPFLYIIF